MFTARATTKIGIDQQNGRPLVLGQIKGVLPLGRRPVVTEHLRPQSIKRDTAQKPSRDNSVCINIVADQDNSAPRDLFDFTAHKIHLNPKEPILIQSYCPNLPLPQKFGTDTGFL
jgi:hypothetical protein